MNRSLLRFSRLVSRASYNHNLNSVLRTQPHSCQILTRSLSTSPTTNQSPTNPVPPTAQSSVPSTEGLADAATSSEVPLNAAALPPDAVTSTAETAAVITDTANNLSDWWLQPALSLINFTHDVTGLPWYMVIAASTIAVRTMLLPATLFTMRNSARMQAIQPDLAVVREGVIEAARAGNQTLAKERQNEMQAFMKNAGVSPFKVLVGPLLQFPVFISFFIGIRRLSQANPDLATGGVAWFTDLSVMDPTYALPLICGVTLFGMTELGGDTGSKMTPQMRTGMRVVAGLSVPMTYWLPTAVFCYWIPNNIFSVCLSLAMKTDLLRRGLGLKVEAAQIPGTKAYKQLQREMATLGRQSGIVKEADVGAAVASYARTAAPGEEVVTVKPVLLKQRPKKTKREASNS